jgi:hypothetical protein
MARLKKIFLFSSCLMFFGFCSIGLTAFAQDDQFPLDTQALDAYVVDKDTKQIFDAGRVPYAGGPGYRKNATVECREMAEEKAKKERLYDWDYYCCTVTPKNECATKVKELY